MPTLEEIFDVVGHARVFVCMWVWYVSDVCCMTICIHTTTWRELHHELLNITSSSIPLFHLLIKLGTKWTQIMLQ
jgi:hypothetical protein